MAFITRRGAVYYLNLRLPLHLYPRCHTLRLSLGIRDRRNAIFVASTLAERLHQHIATKPLTELHTLRLLCAEWRDSTPTPSAAQRAARAPRKTSPKTTDGPSLASLAKLYLEEGTRSGAWRTGSSLDVKRALRDLFELMDDMPASAFGTEHARSLKERLVRCPQYFAQRPEFKGRTLRQVVESSMSYQTITAVTVNNRLRKLTAFFNWCMANAYIERNPLTGMKVLAGAAKDARISFEPGDLQALLQTDTLVLEARKHRWRYWLPLLARFTGARLEELCQLHMGDITSHQGIPCIRIDDRYESQKIKSHSSRRELPIHPKLQELGLLEYVESVRVNNGNRLFPDLVATRDKLGHAPSKWFSRYKKKHGITDPRKTFHSFRHTFIDDLRDAGVQDSLIKRLVGHEDTSATFGIYGSRLPLKAMLDAINKLPLPAEGIDKPKITD